MHGSACRAGKAPLSITYTRFVPSVSPSAPTPATSVMLLVVRRAQRRRARAVQPAGHADDRAVLGPDVVRVRRAPRPARRAQAPRNTAAPRAELRGVGEPIATTSAAAGRAVVVDAARVVVAQPRRRRGVGVAGVRGDGGEVRAGAAERRLLELDERVLHRPEAARAEVARERAPRAGRQHIAPRRRHRASSVIPNAKSRHVHRIP